MSGWLKLAVVCFVVGYVLVASVVFYPGDETSDECIYRPPEWSEAALGVERAWQECRLSGGVFRWEWEPKQQRFEALCIGGV